MIDNVYDLISMLRRDSMVVELTSVTMDFLLLCFDAKAGVDESCVPVSPPRHVMPHGVPLHQQPRPPVGHLEVEAVGVLLGVLGPGLDEEPVLELLSKHQLVHNQRKAGLSLWLEWMARNTGCRKAITGPFLVTYLRLRGWPSGGEKIFSFICCSSGSSFCNK